MEKSNENSVIFHFEELPLELQEHILLRCDDKTLTASMPQLSKFINTLVHDEGSVWRAKCRDYYTESDWEIVDKFKKLNETWRQFYLRNTTYLAQPVKTWRKENVADWARKVLKFSKLTGEERTAVDKSVRIVIEQAFNGTALLLFDDRADLKATLNLPDGHALILWTEIEKLKSSKRTASVAGLDDNFDKTKRSKSNLESQQD